MNTQSLRSKTYNWPIQGFPNACYAHQEKAEETNSDSSDSVKATERGDDLEEHKGDKEDKDK